MGEWPSRRGCECLINAIAGYFAGVALVEALLDSVSYGIGTGHGNAQDRLVARASEALAVTSISA